MPKGLDDVSEIKEEVQATNLQYNKCKRSLDTTDDVQLDLKHVDEGSNVCCEEHTSEIKKVKLLKDVCEVYKL